MQFRLSTLILALAVVPPILGGAIASCNVDHTPDRRDATRNQLKVLENAALTYQLCHIGVPPNLEALVRPPANLAKYLKDVPRDPWDNVFQYEAIDRDNFRIWSCGPDGISGNSDDISLQHF